MTINTTEFLEGISILADKQNMRVAVRHSLKGAMLCAGSAFIGGMVLGPIGLAVGGTVGGFAASAMAKGNFKSVGEIIRQDLTMAQRDMLIEKLTSVLRQLEPTDIAVLLPIIMKNSDIQTAVLKTVSSFITNEMHMRIID